MTVFSHDAFEGEILGIKETLSWATKSFNSQCIISSYCLPVVNETNGPGYVIRDINCLFDVCSEKVEANQGIILVFEARSTNKLLADSLAKNARKIVI